MSQDAGLDDSLARALAEFREELLLWIDTQLARLREREQAEALAVQEISLAAPRASSAVERGSPVGSRTIRPDAGVAVPGSLAALREEDVRSAAKVAGPLPQADAAWPPVDSRGSESGPKSPGASSGSSDRLDALARLLDQRLKQARETMEKSTVANE